MHIAHVALWTRDLDRAASFWEEVFGASVGGLYESARRPGFASRFVRLDGGATLELMAGPWIGDGPPGSPERAGWAHVAVSVGSEEAVMAMADRMRGRGALVSEARRTGDGFFEAVIADPDGNLVEVTA